MSEQFYCACGYKLKCENECRDTNLFRKDRVIVKICPAAYGELVQKPRPKSIVNFKTQIPEFEMLKSSLSVSRTHQSKEKK